MIGSASSRCGSWHDTHCTKPVPVSVCTASPDNGSRTCVSPAALANDTGWSFDKSVPTFDDAGTKPPDVPESTMVPLFSVAPRAIVPSWQLRQSRVDPVGGPADRPGKVLNVAGNVPESNELLP